VDPDRPGLAQQFDGAICYLYLAADQSHQRATGDGHRDVGRRSDQDSFPANHREPVPADSISDNCERIRGRALQPNHRAHRRHGSVSMERVRRADCNRMGGGWRSAGWTYSRRQYRHRQRDSDRWRDVVFPGDANRRDRRNNRQCTEHSDQSQRTTFEPGPIPEPDTCADGCIPRQRRPYTERQRNRIRFRRDR
jgi:hypothetical protein